MKKIKDLDIALTDLRTRTVQLVNASRSANTRVNYTADWKMLREWCEGRSIAFPPKNAEFLALYLAYLIECGHKTTSVARRLPSFRFCYREAGLEPPDLTSACRLLSGARRTLHQPPRQARPFTREQLCAICAVLGSRPVEVRNRALIVLGFASGMRRSEIAALCLEDVRFTEKGLEIIIRRSKTDQEAKGRTIGVPAARKSPCPVRELRRWLRVRGQHSGPLFNAFVGRAIRPTTKAISGAAIHEAVRRVAAAIGLDPKLYGGHSLRASFVTEAVARGAEVAAIMQTTGHKRIETLLRYLRPEPFALKRARAL